MSRSWTQKPHFCGERPFLRRFSLSSTILLCAFLLSACGESTPRGYSGGAVSSSSDTLKPIVAPPRANESPPLPGTTGMPKTPDGLPALSARSVNTALFSEKIGNDDARMSRLENAVQELRNDFDAISPAVVRLVAIEKDIQTLIEQLEVLTGSGPAPAAPSPYVETAEFDDMQGIEAEQGLDQNNAAIGDEMPAQIAPIEAPVAATAETAPTPQAAKPAQIAPPPTAPPSSALSTQSPAVDAIRIGEHPGKVRIVLDVIGTAKFKTDLDNNEKVLVVELPGIGWRAAATKDFVGHPLLSSYSASPLDGGGTMLIFQLGKTSSIGYSGVIATKDAGESRVVIDLSL